MNVVLDSCVGDSGSPIQIQNIRNNPPYWYLAGVVSYGPARKYTYRKLFIKD